MLIDSALLTIARNKGNMVLIIGGSMIVFLMIAMHLTCEKLGQTGWFTDK